MAVCRIGGCGITIPGIAGAGNLLERHVRRNVVARHDLLHASDIFSDVIAVILARVIHPFGVVLIELALVIRRKPALIYANPASGAGDLVVGHIRRNVVLGHDLLHFVHIFGDVVAVVLAGIVHPL